MTETQFKLRLPLGLKATLERLAAKSGRSLSAQIIHQLQLSLQVPSDSRGELRSIQESLERKHQELLSAISNQWERRRFLQMLSKFPEAKARQLLKGAGYNKEEIEDFILSASTIRQESEGEEESDNID
jgi:hypothetical protein